MTRSTRVCTCAFCQRLLRRHARRPPSTPNGPWKTARAIHTWHLQKKKNKQTNHTAWLRCGPNGGRGRAARPTPHASVPIMPCCLAFANKHKNSKKKTNKQFRMVHKSPMHVQRRSALASLFSFFFFCFVCLFLVHAGRRIVAWWSLAVIW